MFSFKSFATFRWLPEENRGKLRRRDLSLLRIYFRHYFQRVESTWNLLKQINSTVWSQLFHRRLPRLPVEWSPKTREPSGVHINPVRTFFQTEARLLLTFKRFRWVYCIRNFDFFSCKFEEDVEAWKRLASWLQRSFHWNISKLERKTATDNFEL